MADVKWIKITTDIFDDEKILLIESLPDAYAIITVWFKLLCLAGKQNNSGVFMMGRIPYTDKMLATIFRMKETTVTMALQTFEQFGMVEIVDGVITIPNWDKHQTLDAYEKKKERDRLYQQERRANQRALVAKSSDTSSDMSTDSSSDVAVSDKDKEEDKEKDKDIINILSDSDESAPSPAKKKAAKNKPIKNKYGEFQNVLLTESEFENLAISFGVELRDKAIRFLDEYIEEKGYKSKSHNLAIRRWVVEAVSTKKAQSPQNKNKSYDTNEFFESAVARSWDKLNENPPKTAADDENIRKRMEALQKQFT